MRLIVDTSIGGVLARRDYDSFGNITFASGNDDLMPFGFVGGLYDVDTGLTQFGAREYDPEVGRWTAKDPSLLRGGGNVYLYTANEPINRFDLNGRFWKNSAETPAGLKVMGAAGLFASASVTPAGRDVAEDTFYGVKEILIACDEAVGISDLINAGPELLDLLIPIFAAAMTNTMANFRICIRAADEGGEEWDDLCNDIGVAWHECNTAGFQDAATRRNFCYARFHR